MPIIYILEEEDFVRHEFVDLSNVSSPIDLTTPSPVALNNNNIWGPHTPPRENPAQRVLHFSPESPVYSPTSPAYPPVPALEPRELTAEEQRQVNLARPRRLFEDEVSTEDFYVALYAGNQHHRERVREWEMYMVDFVPRIMGKYRVTLRPWLLDVTQPPPTFQWDDDWGDILEMFSSPFPYNIEYGEEEDMFFSFHDVWGDIWFGDVLFEQMMTFHDHLIKSILETSVREMEIINDMEQYNDMLGETSVKFAVCA